FDLETPFRSSGAEGSPASDQSMHRIGQPSCRSSRPRQPWAFVFLGAARDGAVSVNDERTGTGHITDLMARSDRQLCTVIRPWPRPRTGLRRMLCWRSLLDAHDRTVREHLRRYGGREINTTGDGFCASFDGPARAIRCARDIIDATVQLGID